MSAPAIPPSHRSPWWQALGPGFVVAATGVGAGDLIAAGVAGSRYGLAVLWVVALGAVFKAVLNEGVSRWQLATGTTLLEGWCRHLPAVVRWYFFGFLLLWSFLVAGALTSACGVAAHALAPAWSEKSWGAAHAVAGFGLVWWGRYQRFEKLMQVLVAGMFIAVIACGAWLHPDPVAILHGLFVPGVPEGSAPTLLALMGGVGGSVTLLCYGYWIRERGWTGPAVHRRSLFDIGSAYAMTGLFGLALVFIATAAAPGELTGNALILALAGRLEVMLGPAGATAFLVGFWCAVFTSLLGVWQGVPYLFADTLALLRHRRDVAAGAEAPALAHSPAYRWYLGYLAFPPLVLLLVERPVAVVMAYAISGAFFMPFLAGVLLYLNNQSRWVGTLRNGWVANLLLTLSLALFAGLFVTEAIATWDRLVAED